METDSACRRRFAFPAPSFSAAHRVAVAWQPPALACFDGCCDTAERRLSSLWARVGSSAQALNPLVGHPDRHPVTCSVGIASGSAL
jgi:hypothetical protein